MQDPSTSAHRDHSVGLVLFGVFQILIGCICVLMMLLMIGTSMMSGATMPQDHPVNLRAMVPAGSFYLVMAVGFIWLGIGSILARRWAWALTVVLSWLWLIMGSFGCVYFFVVAKPMIAASMSQHGQLPPAAIAMVQTIIVVTMTFIFVVLPTTFLLFYHRASLRALCERRDPHIRWTDRCPLPVLALSILMVWSAVGCLPSLVVYGNVMPFFGYFTSGLIGYLVMLLLILLMACLAWGLYGLRIAAWWGTVLLGILGTLNMLLAFTQSNFMEMYERTHLTAAEMELIRSSGFIETMSRMMPWFGVIGGVVFFGYLLYVRRYFVGKGGRYRSASVEG